MSYKEFHCFQIHFSVLLRYTDSDCPISIFKLFLQWNCHCLDIKHQNHCNLHIIINFDIIFHYLKPIITLHFD
jgi:hypothetical protein